MCLIAFSYKDHPQYKLILAANRDEFYDRPARHAQFWEKEHFPEILAGKDLEAGGTWMGVRTTGRWAALTNYRNPSLVKNNPVSRGRLVLDFLKDEVPVDAYLNHIQQEKDLYNGYNLLLSDHNNLYHYSNVSDAITEIEPGIHGVSNALFDTSWPKLNQAKKDLEKVLSQKSPNTEQLFELLKNEHKPPVDQLPDTGIPLEWEKAVSSVFIKTETYGTRCSTLLLIDKENSATFIERRYNPETSSILEERTFKLVFS